MLFPLALAPVATGLAGWLYGVVAAVLGTLFVILALRVYLWHSDRAAQRLFGYSILYLFALFAFLVVDRAPGLLGGPFG